MRFFRSRQTLRNPSYGRLLLQFSALSGLMISLGDIESAVAQDTTATDTTPSVHADSHKKRVTPHKATTPSIASPAMSVRNHNVANSKESLTKPVAEAPPPSHPENIIVTGTLFHDPNLTSASPITQLTSRDLQQRGLKTVSQALQLLSSNGSGNLTNAFSANGAFAAGASAPSLRGLTTDSTLTLMDGQRLAYYPLADDGTRDFVDTNWIPMSIIDRVDVQEDGGSATYGADAVAGVINLVTKKEVEGFQGNAEGGLSQRGDTGHQRLYATYGVGNLDRDGYNFYINSEYQQDDMLTNSQLGYPYNSSNLTGIGGGNGDYNILGSDGTIQNFGQTSAVVGQAINSAGTATSGYQLLGKGCGSVGATNTGYVSGTPAGSSSTVCQMDSVNKYSVIQPYDRRVEATAHLTVNVGSRAQLTGMFTYSQNLSYFTGTPSAIYANTQSALGTSEGVLAPATLPNGSLNPNDPFAAQGESAQLYGLFSQPTTTTEFNQNFRGSLRFAGWEPSNWGGDWNYDANFVGMNSDLTQTYTGYANIKDLDYAIENGTYNFVDQAANSQAAINAIMPPDTIHARTQEYSWQATLNKGLFHLPGGMVNLAIGTNVRYEALNDPSANPVDSTDVNNQYETINPVSAHGSRWVESGFFEVNAPVVKMLNADFQGRYDAYSAGFSHFSPKIGAVFKPSKQFQLRGTWSNGFRVPSFSETSGSSVGYVDYAPSNLSWINQHLNANGTTDSYGQAYSLGLNTVGNPNLKPETSNTFTGGPVFHPVPWITLSAEYYYIRKRNVIVANPIPYTTVADAYIAANATGTQTIDGMTVQPDIADPLHPDAARRPGIIDMSYVNANSMMTDGVDLALSFSHRLPGILHDIQWYSKGKATWVRRFNESVPGVGVEHFAGTLGPWETTSASGTPRWRANWQNTFTYKKLSTTFTVYYTSGYKSQAEDATGPGTAGNCAYSLYADVSSFYPSQCHVRAFWDIDMTLNYQVNKRWSVYTNIYNLAGFKSPYDFGTYGSYLYNSSWSQAGVLGRSFQFGVNLTL